jgi:hypothetical protein
MSFYKRPYFQKSKTRSRKKLDDYDYKSLVKILDKEFGFYIKKTFEIAPGLSRCYTCGNIHETNDIQAGHYISRRYYIVRWDPRNVRPQCSGCNGPRAGEPLRFRVNLVEDIGAKNVENLEFLARFNGERNMPREFLIEQIGIYRKLNKKLRREEL